MTEGDAGGCHSLEAEADPAHNRARKHNDSVNEWIAVGCKEYIMGSVRVDND